MTEEYGECNYCGEGFFEETAQLLQDEIAYHEERCPSNPHNDF